MQRTHRLAMVIGTEQALRAGLARGLAGFGFDCVLIDDDEDGLALLPRLRPTVVIMAKRDAGAATMATLARAVQSTSAATGPVFLCVGEGDAGGLGRAVAEGAAECLVAPFDADLLQFKLELSGLI